MAVVDITEGWTGNLDFYLKVDGAFYAIPTGATVTLILKDKNATVVDGTGDISIVTAADGKVRYTPDATDLVAANSPYTAHWKVTDVAGGIIFFPNGEADKWQVFKQ